MDRASPFDAPKVAPPGGYDKQRSAALALAARWPQVTLDRSARRSARISIVGTMLKAFGEFTTRQTDCNLKLVTVGGGILKVKDELKRAFDIVARR